MSREKFGQGAHIHLRHHKEIAVLQKETVGYQGLEMRMPAGIITEGLDRYNTNRYDAFLAKGKLQKLLQTLWSTLTELTQKFTIVEKELTQDFGNGKYILAVGNRIENRFLEVVAKMNNLFVMAGWVKPATTRAVCQQIFMMTIGAFNTSVALMQIATFNIFSYYMRYDRSVKAVLFLKEIIITFFKLQKMVIK